MLSINSLSVLTPKGSTGVPRLPIECTLHPVSLPGLQGREGGRERREGGREGGRERREGGRGGRERRRERGGRTGHKGRQATWRQPGTDSYLRGQLKEVLRQLKHFLQFMIHITS